MLGNTPSDASTEKPKKSEQSSLHVKAGRVQQFLEGAEQRGYVTLEQINQVLPEAEENIRLLDGIFSLLERHGISVSDAHEEAEEVHPEAESPETDDKVEHAVFHGIAADDTISLYLREMAREPLLSHDEEVELAQRIERGNMAVQKRATQNLSPEERRELEKQLQAAEEARARFILANTRLVVSIAKKYANHGVPFLDLIQEGNLGLIRAVEKFEYRSGHRFSTYATWWIQQAIGRALANQGSTIRIPVHMSKRIRRLRQSARELEQQLGRWPTPEEIGELTEIPPHEVRWMLRISRQPISFEQRVGEEQESELRQFIKDETLPAPLDTVAAVFLAEKMEEVLATLHPREEMVLRLRYGFEDGRNYTLEEVGEHFGLTRERIRQIEAHALRKLRHPRRLRSLRDYL